MVQSLLFHGLISVPSPASSLPLTFCTHILQNLDIPMANVMAQGEDGLISASAEKKKL